MEAKLGLGSADAGRAKRQPMIRVLDRLRGDLRFAARSIARRPGPATLAAATFALGVAASVSMYSVVDAVLLRPLPYPDPERLVSVYPTIPEWRTHTTLHESWDRANFSYPEYAAWQATQRSFESVAAMTRRVVTLSAGGAPERVQIGRVSPSLFPMLGVVPALGRAFAADEDDRIDAVLLLSHGLWQRRFGADPSVVGRTVRLSDELFTIIGVLPADFRLEGYENDAWSPLGAGGGGSAWDNHNITVLGRLAARVTVAATEAETTRLLRDISPPGHFTAHGANLVPRVSDLTRNVRRPLMLLVVAAGLLLAVSCASVGAVLLGVGIDRETELSVRAALGATRTRLA
ncbi:MAG: ABC transporter permease, partial [Longimicrobiales bacterium]